MVDQKNRFTRYFNFTRTNPKPHDYELLKGVCKNINAACFMDTIVDSGGVTRLQGYMVLWGPRTHKEDLARIFPNFLITPMEQGEFVRLPPGHHPFDCIKKKLF